MSALWVIYQAHEHFSRPWVIHTWESHSAMGREELVVYKSYDWSGELSQADKANFKTGKLWSHSCNSMMKEFRARDRLVVASDMWQEGEGVWHVFEDGLWGISLYWPQPGRPRLHMCWRDLYTHTHTITQSHTETEADRSRGPPKTSRSSIHAVTVFYRSVKS